MERGFVFTVLLLVSSLAISKEILIECGNNSGLGFNGWSVDPYSSFTTIDFSEETISFFAENGGDYSIQLTRHIVTMKEFSNLSFDLRFDRLENCVLNSVDVLVSANGKNWEAVDVNDSDYSGIISNDIGLQYIRIVANVSFFQNGFLEFVYFKLEGDDPITVHNNLDISTEAQTLFFVFCFNKSINVETKDENPYEVIFTNLAGQIMYRESAVGSSRIESSLPEGIYIVSVIQNNQVKHSKKVFF